MAPKRKITKVGGNLPLVAQFRVLCCLGLLTMRHSFFSSFFFLYSSFFFSSFLLSFLFSFPPFLFSFTPFLFSLPPPPCCSPHELNLSSHIYSSQSAMHMVRHVSPTWFVMCHPHGSPCVARHPRCLEIREIPTISDPTKFN